jgi:hypothetical protein
MRGKSSPPTRCTIAAIQSFRWSTSGIIEDKVTRDPERAAALIGVYYIKTASPDAIAAMKQFSEALLCSTCAPDGDVKVKGSVQ